jgi:hypothetical protein
VLQLTVPLGVEPLPPLVSVTVAVQVVASFTVTEDGEQLTLVALARFTMMSKLPLEVKCGVSPP